MVHTYVYIIHKGTLLCIEVSSGFSYALCVLYMWSFKGVSLSLFTDEARCDFQLWRDKILVLLQSKFLDGKI